jgi:hypothetical protein
MKNNKKVVAGSVAMAAALAFGLAPQIVPAAGVGLPGITIPEWDTGGDDLLLADDCFDDSSNSFSNASMIDGLEPMYEGWGSYDEFAEDATNTPDTLTAAVMQQVEKAGHGFKLYLANCHDAPPPPDVTGTNGIGGRISAINSVCDDVQMKFRIYCLANQYTALAQQLPDSGQYYDMKRTIKKAAADLRALADANLDEAVAPQAIRSVGRDAPQVARKPVAAVREDNLEETTAAALAILDEATTTLLRSSEGSQARRVQYQTVAAGIDSSKVLLRSA